jgi:hypothetical protein
LSPVRRHSVAGECTTAPLWLWRGDPASSRQHMGSTQA